jgi:choline dehydrogenase-like flavoprotein
VQYDVVVVGGGTAGCVLAARLSEEPSRTVCLVEAGPDYGPCADGRWPADILDGRWLALDSHRWEQDDPDDRSQARAQILGGCSAHNACVMLRGADADYDEWGPGWTADELRPCLDRAERMFRTRVLTDRELSPWHRAFAEVAGDDAIVHPVNMTEAGVRWTAAFAYVDPARDRENLTILADTLVDRVLLDGDRAVGIATSGGDVEAGTIVLTAGAYGSPGVLLRSGIGPESGLPVGEGLADHVGTGMGWEPTDELRATWDAFLHESPLAMAGVTIRARSRNCPEGVCDLFMFSASDPGHEISGAAYAMKPRSRGRVTLNSPDPRAALRIDHGFLSDEADVAVLTEGFEHLRELGRSEPVRRYAAQEIRPGEDVSAEAHVRATARGFFHPTGTCAIGSVVDERGRVLGHENLVVADASIMPTIPRANTNLTTAAIAERIAELL